jgi:hypothetical protein
MPNPDITDAMVLVIHEAEQMVKAWRAEWGDHDPSSICPCCKVDEAIYDLRAAAGVDNA